MVLYQKKTTIYKQFVGNICMTNIVKAGHFQPTSIAVRSQTSRRLSRAWGRAKNETLELFKPVPRPKLTVSPITGQKEMLLNPAEILNLARTGKEKDIFNALTVGKLVQTDPYRSPDSLTVTGQKILAHAYHERFLSKGAKLAEQEESAIFGLKLATITVMAGYVLLNLGLPNQIAAWSGVIIGMVMMPLRLGLNYLKFNNPSGSRFKALEASTSLSPEAKEILSAEFPKPIMFEKTRKVLASARAAFLLTVAASCSSPKVTLSEPVTVCQQLSSGEPK